MPIVVLVVCAVIAAILFSRLPSVDVAGPLRMWLWKRELARMEARHSFPAEVKRSYWTAREYRVDSDRLRALGYEVVLEEACEPLAPTADVATRGLGQPVRSRRLPAYFVRYERALRDSSATPAPSPPPGQPRR